MEALADNAALTDEQIPEYGEPIKLNLGAADTVIPGYTPIDRKFGTEAYPLEYPDGSVDEIRASHVLEHFSHNEECGAVVKHWVDKLKPGGRLRIAVPNFEWIAKQYLDGVPIPSQGYVMGGHVDPNDRHGCIFDRESLRELLLECGLERIGEWQSEIQDCAALDVSLNLQGFKPSGKQKTPEGLYAVMSAPRFGPMMHMNCAAQAFGPLGINYEIGQGAYWQQVLTSMIERVIGLETCRYILTMDYDTIFRASDVIELYRLMEALPEYSAICALQSRRCDDTVLMGKLGKNGKPITGLYAADFGTSVQEIYTGHFGLTLIRKEVFEQIEKPWFMPHPSPRDNWDDGRVDADIDFWHKVHKAGLKAGLANKVVVGHMQELITWPGDDLKPIYQHSGDYARFGIPKEVRR